MNYLLLFEEFHSRLEACADIVPVQSYDRHLLHAKSRHCRYPTQIQSAQDEARPAGILMASIVLCRRRGMTKQEVAGKGTQRDGNHDPAVVSHEDEPGIYQATGQKQTKGALGKGGRETYMSIKA